VQDANKNYKKEILTMSEKKDVLFQINEFFHQEKSTHHGIAHITLSPKAEVTNYKKNCKKNCYVLKGEAYLIYSSKIQPIHLVKDDVVIIPGDTDYTLQNPSNDPASLLIVHTDHVNVGVKS
jgi:mannose-6-phosphate isomerase-like protein (cupin superfamily)